MGFQGNLLLTRICSPTQAPSCQFCVGPGQGPGSCASCSAPGPCDSARPVQEVLGAGGDAVCSLWQRPEVHRRAGPGGLEQSPAPRQNTAPSQKQLSANAGPSWRPNAEPAEFPCGLSRLSSRGPSGWPDRNAGRARQHCALAWSGARDRVCAAPRDKPVSSGSAQMPCFLLPLSRPAPLASGGVPAFLSLATSCRRTLDNLEAGLIVPIARVPGKAEGYSLPETSPPELGLAATPSTPTSAFGKQDGP